MFFRLSLLFSVAWAVNVQEDVLSVDLMTKFKKWVDFHGKVYTTHEEKMQRLQNWVDNDGTL
jgi:hypothetical protein